MVFHLTRGKNNFARQDTSNAFFKKMYVQHFNQFAGFSLGSIRLETDTPRSIENVPLLLLGTIIES